MIASPQSRTFTLADGRQATFLFFRADRFGHVLRDHILNENEPWSRVLHLKVKRQENLRQQIGSRDVSERDAAEEELYAQCIDVLAGGITYSIGVPVYVEFIQERRSGPQDAPYRTQGFYFLADAGFLIVVRANIVRTAFFETGIKGKRDLSRVGLFLAGWHHVKKLIDRETEYLDSKDREYVKHVSVKEVSSENWIRPPLH
jgi:hypothetical protein